MASLAAHVPSSRMRASVLVAGLAFANILVWAAALRLSSAYPVLLGSALLAYGLGLRHAFDADHIAAIDNVTRRLVASGGKPVGVGFFFSLGHSTVVFAATVGVALTASRFQAQLGALQHLLAPIGGLASALFLMVIAGLNVMVFVGLWRAVRQPVKCDGVNEQQVRPMGLFASGLTALLRRIDRSWMMYPVGVVFGLGFDTATEIGLLGLAAAQAAKGLGFWSILVFPALFTAGMALADTLEALFMLGAYRWSSTRPASRLYYSLAVTAVSIVAGLGIALSELADLAPRPKALGFLLGGALRLLSASAEVMAANSAWVGLGLVLMFAALWGGWVVADGAQSGRRARPGSRRTVYSIATSPPSPSSYPQVACYSAPASRD